MSVWRKEVSRFKKFILPVKTQEELDSLEETIRGNSDEFKELVIKYTAYLFRKHD